MDNDNEIKHLKLKVSLHEEAIGQLFQKVNELAEKAGVAQSQPPKSPR